MVSNILKIGPYLVPNRDFLAYGLELPTLQYERTKADQNDLMKGLAKHNKKIYF